MKNPDGSLKKWIINLVVFATFLVIFGGGFVGFAYFKGAGPDFSSITQYFSLPNVSLILAGMVAVGFLVYQFFWANRKYMVGMIIAITTIATAGYYNYERVYDLNSKVLMALLFGIILVFTISTVINSWGWIQSHVGQSVVGIVLAIAAFGYIVYQCYNGTWPWWYLYGLLAAILISSALISRRQAIFVDGIYKHPSFTVLGGAAISLYAASQYGLSNEWMYGIGGGVVILLALINIEVVGNTIKKKFSAENLKVAVRVALLIGIPFGLFYEARALGFPLLLAIVAAVLGAVIYLLALWAWKDRALIRTKIKAKKDEFWDDFCNRRRERREKNKTKREQKMKELGLETTGPIARLKYYMVRMLGRSGGISMMVFGSLIFIFSLTLKEAYVLGLPGIWLFIMGLRTLNFYKRPKLVGLKVGEIILLWAMPKVNGLAVLGWLFLVLHHMQETVR